METLAGRLAGLIEETGKERSDVINDLAKLCNVKSPSVYGWLDGSTKRLAGTNLILAADYFGVNPFWLDSGKGAKRVESERPQHSLREPDAGYGVSSDVYATIKELRNELGAGGTAVLRDFDEVAGERAYRRDWLEKEGLIVDNLRIVKVKGDSMVPYVFHGNKVLVNTAEKRIIDGEHYAIRVGDEPKIKRLFTQGDGKVRIESYNAPTDFVTRDDDWEVLGLVVDRGGTSRYRS